MKLNGFKFTGKNLLIEEARKKPSERRKFASKTRSESAEQLKPGTSNTELIPPKQQSPVQKITNSYADIASPKMKNVVIFSDSMVKGLKMKQFNSHIHGGKVYLKAFPDAKVDQLNHHVKTTLEKYKYNAAIIHVGINDILRSKGENEVNDIPRKVMNIVGNCGNYNIPKIFISSIIRCSRTTVKIRELCIQNNHEIISNMQSNEHDLWRDEIHLQESGKILISKNFVNSVNNCLSKT